MYMDAMDVSYYSGLESVRFLSKYHSTLDNCKCGIKMR